MIPLVDEPVVQLYWDSDTDQYRAKTNIGQNVKVDLAAEPKNGQADQAKFQGLPYTAEIS